MNMKIKVKSNLSTLRKRRRMSCSKLARMVDMTAQSVNQVELGINMPKLDTAYKYQLALNIDDIEEIFPFEVIDENV